MNKTRTAKARPDEIPPGAPHHHRVTGSRVTQETIADQVVAIETMDRDALLTHWTGCLGGRPTARLSQPLLRRILAFELQARD